MSDSALVKKILNGDRAAGERFVSANYPRIFRLLRCLTSSTDAAQDLTQQTFARAWKGLPSFQGRASLSTWLHKIAYHEYSHWMRSRREDLPLDCAADMADLREVRGLDTILVSRALARLPEEHRETFLLFYLQEFTVGEIAEILDVPAGTVKSRLFTARHRLREMIQAADAPTVPGLHSGAESAVLYRGAEGGLR